MDEPPVRCDTRLASNVDGLEVRPTKGCNSLERLSCEVRTASAAA
jgi:hypothetical protein